MATVRFSSGYGAETQALKYYIQKGDSVAQVCGVGAGVLKQRCIESNCDGNSIETSTNLC